MANEIDLLMDLDPLSLTAEDIDKVVDYLRGSYRTHEQSAKFSNSGKAEDKPKLDLSSLGLGKPAVALTRRKL